MARFLQTFRDLITVNGRYLGFNKEGQCGTEALSVSGHTTGQYKANPVFCAPSGFPASFSRD